MSAPRGLLYWDPMPHVAAVFAAFPKGWPYSDRGTTFQGRWEERNPLNVPGPFYGAATDNCWVGRLHAPRHVLYGDGSGFEPEFLYRQPSDIEELRAVIVAAQEDPFAGWACDGDLHWTPGLVRTWWRDRARLREWITAKHRQWWGSQRPEEREAATGLVDYLGYVDDGLAGYLRAYSYFLDNNAAPTAEDRLPEL